MLQMPIPPNGNPSEMVVGNSNALLLHANSTGEYKWIAPPADVATTFETRIENTVREIYRLARESYDTVGGVAESGVARAYKFEPTNRKLGDFAMRLAASERQSLQLVGSALGASADAVEQITVSAPQNFQIDDLAADLANAMSAIQLQLGPTAEMELRRRVTKQMLPNLPSDVQAAIDEELEGSRDKAAQLLAEQEQIDAAGDAGNAETPEPPPGMSAGGMMTPE
jgi:hypothetical protein